MSPTSESLSVPLNEGLRRLYQAYRFANDVAHDPWEFAVEIEELRRCGMVNAEFRWLMCKGFLEHAREVADESGERRKFVASNNLRLFKRSCFRLSERGVALAKKLVRPHELGIESQFDGVMPGGNGGLIKPKWDGERHQFFVQERLVKEFKVPSPNQETVLTAFQEEGWPVRIDDPLAPMSQVDSKRRLHDTIKSLNRNQKRKLIRFMGDGTGEGVQWRLTIPDAAHSAS